MAMHGLGRLRSVLNLSNQCAVHIGDGMVLGWCQQRYAYFALLGSVCATGMVAAFPVIERRYGTQIVGMHRHRLPIVLASIAGTSAVLAFRLRGQGPLTVGLHALLGGIFASSSALLGVSLRAIAAKCADGNQIGRSFGLFSAWIERGEGTGRGGRGRTVLLKWHAYRLFIDCIIAHA